MTNLTRREFLKSSAAGPLAAVAIGSPAFAASKRKPNVIYIMTDQQRKDTLRCCGNDKVQTPALDGLAQRGVLFTSCYTTQPVCSPCRSSMVTGLFPNTTGVVENNIPLPPDKFSWMRAMHDAGYRVCYVGKWHLGTDPVPDYLDCWRGFHTGWRHWIKDEPYYPQPGESESAFRKELKGKSHPTPSGGSVVGKYRPDVETDYAIEFITENKNRLFVCWLSFYPPHTPKTAPDENVALYKGKIQPDEQAIYHAMVNRLDANVARLLKAVDKLGLRGNTIVVFTSDHGENYPWGWNRHHKRLCYDQSANVPLIFSWPGMLPQGRRIENVISIVDLCPTILDLCGLPWPDSLHGRSAKKLMLGDANRWHKDVFIQNSPYTTHKKPSKGGDSSMRERCVVTDDWKLILNTHRAPELYDRRAAEPDRDNVFGRPENRTIVDGLVERLAAWGKNTDDAMTAKLIAQWFAAV
ncbi:MAG: sulfatase-like hydrolase/transferase [Planctomycetota bacterium]|jgi:arylsulfatase A-like enzyme